MILIYLIKELFIFFEIYLNIKIKWGLGIGDWAQSPIPNPQSPCNYIFKEILNFK